MDCFKHRPFFADICRAGKTDRAGDLRGDIGEDISVEIGHDDDIEDFGGIGEFGRSNVDDPALI